MSEESSSWNKAIFFFPGNSLTVSWGRGDSNALAGTLAFMSTGAASSLGPSLHRHEVSKRKHLLHRAQEVLHRAQGLYHLTEEPSFPKGSTAMLEVFLPFLLPTSQSAKMCWDTNASVVSAALRIQGKKTGQSQSPCIFFYRAGISCSSSAHTGYPNGFF